MFACFLCCCCFFKSFSYNSWTQVILTSTTSIKRAKKRSFERKSIRHEKAGRLATNFCIRFYFFLLVCKIQAKINQTITFIRSFHGRRFLPALRFRSIWGIFCAFTKGWWWVCYFSYFHFPLNFSSAPASRQPCIHELANQSSSIHTKTHKHSPRALPDSYSFYSPWALDNITWSSPGVGGNRNYWNPKSFHPQQLSTSCSWKF